ncbi:MAG: elongation factor P [Candidatus Dormiibacterota bacterium]
MINAGELRSGTTVERNGQLWEVLSQEHVKLGRGTALIRTRLRNITTGSLTEETFRPEERFSRARIEKVDVQFLYRDGEHYVVMDTASYDQYPLDEAQFAEATRYVKEGDHLYVLQYDGKVIGVELPITVELEVTATDPGYKGDTATGGSKPATLSTGLVVEVPLFVGVGDTLKVDTRTAKYLERVQ